MRDAGAEFNGMYDHMCAAIRACLLATYHDDYALLCFAAHWSKPRWTTPTGTRTKYKVMTMIPASLCVNVNLAAVAVVLVVVGCVCDPGWQGYDCSLRSCPMGRDPTTGDDSTEEEDEVYELQCQADSGFFAIFILGYHYCHDNQGQLS